MYFSYLFSSGVINRVIDQLQSAQFRERRIDV